MCIFDLWSRFEFDTLNKNNALNESKKRNKITKQVKYNCIIENFIFIFQVSFGHFNEREKYRKTGNKRMVDQLVTFFAIRTMDLESEIGRSFIKVSFGRQNATKVVVKRNSVYDFSNILDKTHDSAALRQLFYSVGSFDEIRRLKKNQLLVESHLCRLAAPAA